MDKLWHTNAVKYYTTPERTNCTQTQHEWISVIFICITSTLWQNMYNIKFAILTIFKVTQGKKETQINRTERGDITTDLKEIKIITKKYYE